MITLTHEDDLAEEGGARTHAFEGRAISIGRTPGNDLVLPVAHISSQHATISYRDGEYALSDLGSTNGSVVVRGEERILLGERGVPELALREGDLLVLGDIDHPVRLRVGLSAPPRAAGGGVRNTIVATLGHASAEELSRRVLAHPGSFEVLFGLVGALNRARADDEILPRVAESALEAIPGAADALVIRMEPRERGPGLCPVVKAAAHRGAGISRSPDEAICAEVARTGEALLFGRHDASVLPAETLISRGLGSGIAAPLLLGTRVVGVLQVNCAPGELALGPTHLDLAVVLSHHAAVALERTDLLARLRAAELRLRDENSLLRRKTQPEVEMVAASASMARVVAELERAAASDVTVLLEGETGTGKEVAARLLHARSRRASGLLVPVNCGALAESLLDAELFGYRKGAFTGAASDRKGVFEIAEGGTVFLDEVGEMPPTLQVRLLRVLEEGRIKVLGDPVERPVDVRIVAATNRDLARDLEAGRFRKDLYYRLRVFPVVLPPLRARREDIAPLVALFVRRVSAQLGRRLEGFDASLVEALERYDFPGNVRELANEIERAAVRAEEGETLTAAHLSEEILSAAAPLPALSPSDRPLAEAGAGGGLLHEQLAAVERRIIEETLARHGGKRVPAARELGLTRQGLAKKMARLGIPSG
jgi:Nif-specific regulatory protein